MPAETRHTSLEGAYTALHQCLASHIDNTCLQGCTGFASTAYDTALTNNSEACRGVRAYALVMCMVVLAGESVPVMSGMKMVARSRGARLAASLDTGTVLRDLLQTVAPATPNSTGMCMIPVFSHLWLRFQDPRALARETYPTACSCCSHCCSIGPKQLRCSMPEQRPHLSFMTARQQQRQQRD